TTMIWLLRFSQSCILSFESTLKKNLINHSGWVQPRNNKLLFFKASRIVLELSFIRSLNDAVNSSISSSLNAGSADLNEPKTLKTSGAVKSSMSSQSGNLERIEKLIEVAAWFLTFLIVFSSM